MMETVPCYYRVDRRHINYIKFIIEAYEGVAVLTTLDAEAGLIVLAVAPGCESMVRAIMADMGAALMIEAAGPP